MKAKLRLKNVIFCSIMYVYIKKGGFEMYSDYGANTLLATSKVTSSAVWIIISAVLAIATHYLVMSSAGALCAVIVCIVAFLCVPSRKKTRYILSPILPENDQKEE